MESLDIEVRSSNFENNLSIYEDETPYIYPFYTLLMQCLDSRWFLQKCGDSVKSHGIPKTRLFGFALHNPKREFAISERNFVNFWIVGKRKCESLCVIFYSNVSIPKATNWSFWGNSKWFWDFTFYHWKNSPNYPRLLLLSDPEFGMQMLIQTYY
jgi:hypothetical protein